MACGIENMEKVWVEGDNQAGTLHPDSSGVRKGMERGTRAFCSRKKSEFTGRPRTPGEGVGICNYKANFCLPRTPRGIGTRTTQPGPPGQLQVRVNVTLREGPFINSSAKGVLFSQLCRNLHRHQSGEPLELTEDNSCVCVFYGLGPVLGDLHTSYSGPRSQKETEAQRGDMTHPN